MITTAHLKAKARASRTSQWVLWNKAWSWDRVGVNEQSRQSVRRHLTGILVFDIPIHTHLSLSTIDYRLQKDLHPRSHSSHKQHQSRNHQTSTSTTILEIITDTVTDPDTDIDTVLDTNDVTPWNGQALGNVTLQKDPKSFIISTNWIALHYTNNRKSKPKSKSKVKQDKTWNQNNGIQKYFESKFHPYLEFSTIKYDVRTGNRKCLSGVHLISYLSHVHDPYSSPYPILSYPSLSYRVTLMLLLLLLLLTMFASQGMFQCATQRSVPKSMPTCIHSHTQTRTHTQLNPES